MAVPHRQQPDRSSGRKRRGDAGAVHGHLPGAELLREPTAAQRPSSRRDPRPPQRARGITAPGRHEIAGTTQDNCPTSRWTKQRPSNAAIAMMVAFTVSCIGLLLFLWISFGGSIPFAPGVPLQRRVRTGRGAGARRASHDLRRGGRPRGQHRARPEDGPRPCGDPDRHAIRCHGRPTHARFCARKRCLVRPTSSCRPAIQTGPSCLTERPCRAPRWRRPCSWIRSSRPLTRPRARRSRPGCSRAGSRSPIAASSSTPRSPTCTRSLSTSSRCSRCSVARARRPYAAARRRPGVLGARAVAVGAAVFVRNNNALFAATAARDTALAATFKAFPAFLTQSRRRSTRSRASPAHDQAARRRAAAGGCRAQPDARVGGRACARATRAT